MNSKYLLNDNEKREELYINIIPINYLYNEFKYICKIEINTDNNIKYGSGFFIKLEKIINHYIV